MKITAPSRFDLADATALLVNSTTSSGSSSLTGGFPQGCTTDIALPDDFVSVESLEWDIYPVFPAPYDLFTRPQYSGNRPVMYYVRGTKLRVSPFPTLQKVFHIMYKHTAAEYATVTTTSAACPLPAGYHPAACFYAASMVAEGNFESTQANRLFARFQEQVQRYKVIQGNQSTSTRPRRTGALMDLTLKVGDIS